MSDPEQITGKININFGEMREVINLAIRRVCAFVRFGLDELEDRDVEDFNLSASVVYSFWPHDISKEQHNAAREEYRSWLIGSCLKELDMFYGLFLDKLWYAIEVGELHGTLVPSGHQFDRKFSKNTNIASKQRDVAKKLGMSDYIDELNSLSLARNCLTHNAGIVRSPVDCNDDERNTLSIKWLAFEMRAIRDGVELVVENAPFDTKSLPGDGKIQLDARYATREFEVTAGQQIRLTNAQIADLCMFYKVLCDKTMKSYRDFLVAKGILE